MRFADFWLLWKGYNDKVWREHDLIRMQTSILYYASPNMSKTPKPKFERFWPDRNKEKKPKISDAVKNRLKKLREEEALRQYNEKNGTAT